jgi:MYXO-CTERM domain-containing protein
MCPIVWETQVCSKLNKSDCNAAAPGATPKANDSESSGCGCRLAGERRKPPALIYMVAALLALLRLGRRTVGRACAEHTELARK